MVELGELDPEAVVTPGIFVKRVVQVQAEEAAHEQATTMTRDQMAARVARTFPKAPT